MSDKQKRMRWMPGDKKSSGAGGTDEGNGRHPSSGLLAWYFTQREVPGLKYALTINGYVPM